MKSIHKIFLSLGLIASTMLVSCKSELYDFGFGEGTVEVSLKEDLDVEVINTKASDPIYTVQILDKNGAVVKTYSDHTAMPSSIELKAGEYTVKAFSAATLPDAAFDAPYYAGQADFVVLEGKTTTTSLTCSLQNVEVSVQYAQNVKDNFTAYSVAVTNEDAGILNFDEDEVKHGFFKNSGKLKWVLTLTNSNGSTYTLQDEIENVKGKQHYALSFSVSTSETGAGGVNSTVTIDKTTNEINHDINIILNPSAKPQISGSGFDLDSPLQVVLGTSSTYAVSFLAESKISDIVLTHSSAKLTSLGLPTRFSLVSSSDSEKSAVNALGITWGSVVEDATTATLNFSTLLNSLPLGTYDITIQILDKQNQSVTKTLNAVVIPDVDVTTNSVSNVWAQFATVEGQWNTVSKPSGVGFAYKKTTEVSWTSVPESLLTITGSSFKAVLTGLTPNTNYQIKAVTSTEDNANVLTFKTQAAEQLENMNFDSWSSSTVPNSVWGTGNNSFASMTSQENSNVQGGSGSAAKLASQEVNAVIIKKFAAGNIYSGGNFKVSGMGGEMDFGIPYTCRPTSMSGYYDYVTSTISSYAVAPYTVSGQNDFCSIYVILADWDQPFHVNSNTSTFIDVKNDPAIIGYGELSSDQTTGGYKPFKISIKYRSERTPKYVVVVASASKYGDYFSGGTSSVLYVDNFSFGFSDVPSFE